MIFDEEGAVTGANPAARDLFRLRRLPAPLSGILPRTSVCDLKACVRKHGTIEFTSAVGPEVYTFVLKGDGAGGRLYGWPVGEVDSHALVSDLQRRMKELACVYALAEAMRTSQSIQDVCKGLVRLVPQAWQYPEQARARVILDAEEYASEPVGETPWGQSAVIVANNVARGMVQVFYPSTFAPPNNQEPFLPEERRLLDTLARTLGEAIERREAESANRATAAQLALERNQLAAIVQHMGEGVVVTDRNDSIVLINAAARSLLRVHEGELAGRNLLDFIADGAFKAFWAETAQRGEDFAKRDMQVKGGEPRVLWATRTRVVELPEEDALYVAIFHDMTRELEIDQLKSDFLTAVSHDLRTPLTSIKGFAATLRKKPDMPPHLRRHFLTIIDEEADRLITLIEQLLMLTRIEAGQLFIEQQPVDIDEIVEQVARALMPELAKRGIYLDRHVEENLKPVGDPEKIHTVVYNLVDNAIKFSPRESHIYLSTARAGQLFELTVRDCGPGIPSDEQELIFERFYRAKHPEGNDTTGTGLGLFIVRELVRLHHGDVAVKSAPGEGAVFTVRLPASDSVGVQAGRPGPENAGGPS